MKKPLFTVFAVLVSVLVATDNARADEDTGAGDGETTVTLINPFEVPAGKLDEAIRLWEQARDFLRQQPGYISTELHQSLSPDAPYPLINIAKWESVETFKAATGKMRTEANLPRIEGLRPAPQLYTVIRN